MTLPEANENTSADVSVARVILNLGSNGVFGAGLLGGGLVGGRASPLYHALTFLWWLDEKC